MKVDRVTLRLPRIYRKPVNNEERGSLIDLLKGYSSTVFYGGSYSGKKVFGCNIKIEGTQKSLWLEIYENGSGVFFIEEKGIRKEIEQFNTLKLRPEYVHRTPSSWVNAGVGFDYIVNVLYFKEIMSRCGLEEEVVDGTNDKYVTLSQLKNEKVKWSFREIISYDLQTSIPTYKDASKGRDITQSDVDEINRILEKYKIITSNRICHFLAQCYVECGGGLKPIEQFNGDVFEYFRDYETGDKAIWLGNTEKNDGAKFRGAGAIQITGRANYRALSEDPSIKNPQILNDGALYVGQKYFWESAGHYWSVYKPNSASTDIYNLNKKCDEDSSVRDITSIINPGLLKLPERQAAYEYFKSVIK